MPIPLACGRFGRIFYSGGALRDAGCGHGTRAARRHDGAAQHRDGRVLQQRPQGFRLRQLYSDDAEWDCQGKDHALTVGGR